MTATDTAPSHAELEIISDVVCPWCYIGKHRLTAGLEQLQADIDLKIRWRPFELNPGLPATGMDRAAYCEAKFGSVSRAQALYENIAANAAADGLPFEPARINRTPNTRSAHRLIELAGELGCQDAMVDCLFRAYFVDGADIGDHATLTDLAAEIGIERERAAAALTAPDGDVAIEAAAERSAALGVHGVPAFVYNGRLLFSGAQSPETIALAIARAVKKGL